MSDTITVSGEVAPGPSEFYILDIHSSPGTRLAAIRPDGSILYGPNYTPDEAARIFWEAIAGGGQRFQFALLAEVADWLEQEAGEQRGEGSEVGWTFLMLAARKLRDDSWEERT